MYRSITFFALPLNVRIRSSVGSFVSVTVTAGSVEMSGSAASCLATGFSAPALPVDSGFLGTNLGRPAAISAESRGDEETESSFAPSASPAATIAEPKRINFRVRVIAVVQLRSAMEGPRQSRVDATIGAGQLGGTSAHASCRLERELDVHLRGNGLRVEVLVVPVGMPFPMDNVGGYEFPASHGGLHGPQELVRVLARDVEPVPARGHVGHRA